MDWRVKSSDLDKWTQDDVTKMKNIGNAKGKLVYTTMIPPPTAFDQGKAHQNWLRDKYGKKSHADVASKEKSAPVPKGGTALPPISTPTPITTSTPVPAPSTQPPKKDNIVDLISMEAPPPQVMRAASSPNFFSAVPRQNSFDSGTLKESIMSMYTAPIAPATKQPVGQPTPVSPTAKPSYPAPNYNVNLNPNVNPYYVPNVVPPVSVKPNYNVHFGTPGVPPPYAPISYPYGPYPPNISTPPGGYNLYPTSPPLPSNKPAPVSYPPPSSNPKLNDFSLL